MVVEEIIHIYLTILTELILDRMGNFKVVSVVVRRIDALVALVIGHAVEHLGICPMSVISVNNLAHKPEIRLHTACEIMYALDEIICKAIGSIEADTVDVPFFYPVFDSGEKIIYNFTVVKIELYKVVAVVPALVPKAVIVSGIPAEVKSAEPILVA